MSKGNKKYTEEFKSTIVELHNAGKTLGELSSEHGLSKSTIAGWVKKNQTLAVEKDKVVTQADYQAMLKKMAWLEEENAILKNQCPYLQKNNFNI